MDGFAVIDVETTGFSPANDRVIEVAVVLLHPSGVAEGEWESLVNPMRDVGASWVHGITDDDVAQAPTFDELAGALGELCAGRVLVAHNLSFDARMLAAEFARAGHDVGIAANAGLCTMKLAQGHAHGGKCTLEACCVRYDIPQPDAHRALADARVTGRLLRELADREDLETTRAAEIERSLALAWPLGLRAARPWPRG